MSTSNTRSVLAHYEGQLIYLKGRLTEVRRKPEKGVVDFLLTSAVFTPFDMDVALRETKPLPGRHHVWQRISAEEFEEWSPEMLTEIDSVGRVGQYARADGSVDWTISTKQTLRLDNVVHKVMRRLEHSSNGKRHHRLVRYRNVLDHLDQGTLCWSWSMPSNELIRWIRDDVASIEAAMKREALAPANGQCKRLKSNRLPGNTHQTATGFA